MSNVEDFILDLEPERAEIVEKVREIILACSPTITEKISHKIPFFCGRKKICYINLTIKGIDLGFSKGFELSNIQGALEAKDRNTVKSLPINSMQDINEDLIIEILNEAILLDEEYKK